MAAYVAASLAFKDLSSTTSRAISRPSGAIGDKIFIFFGIDSASDTLTQPAGFTTIFDDVDADGAATGEICWKLFGEAEPGSYTLTSGVSEKGAWVTQLVRDAGDVNVLSSVNTGTGTTATIPSITTTEDDCLVFAVVIADRVTGLHSTISGYSNHEYSSESSGASVSVQSKVLATAGEESGNTVTWDTSEQWLAVAFAIEPGTIINQAAGGLRTGARTGGAAITESFYYPSGGVRNGLRVGGQGVASTEYFTAADVRIGARVGGVGLAVTGFYPAGGIRQGIRLGGRAVAHNTTNDSSRLALPASLANGKNGIVLPQAPRVTGAKLNNGL